METTVEFDLTVEQAMKIVEPRWSGPIGALARRMSAKQMERMAARLAGPTTVKLSDTGIQVATADSERRIDWSEVRGVNERTHAWVLTLAPSGLCLIPADAVPTARLAEFGAELRAIAGAKYKVREGGMRHP